MRLLPGQKPVVLFVSRAGMCRIVVRYVMRLMRLAETLLAVKNEEVHAEGIKSGNEHADHHSNISKA